MHQGARQPLRVWEVTGIGGVHGRFVQPPSSPMTLLAAPLPVRYAVLDDKDVGRHVLEGCVVRLAETGAEIQSSVPVPLLSTLKLWMPAIAVGAGPSELAATVVDASPTSGSGVIVRFTALAPAMVQDIRGRFV